MKTLVIAGAILISPLLFAQGAGADTADGVYGYGGATDGKKYDDSYSVDASIMANSKDWYVGGELCVYSLFNIGVGFQCLYRFDERPVFVQRDENIYRQYQETRWITGFHLNKDFMFGAMGVYVQAGWTITTGDYQGSADDPDSSSGRRWSVGWVYRGGFIRARLGYQYTRIPNFPDNFLIMSFGAIF
jgi:hypothetical protein